MALPTPKANSLVRSGRENSCLSSDDLCESLVEKILRVGVDMI